MTRVPATTFRRVLLAGASVSAIIAAGPANADGPFGRRGSLNPTTQAQVAAQAGATQTAAATAAAVRSRAAFARAAEMRQQMDATQAAARAAARAAVSLVPNGLGAGGLQVANGVETNPLLWTGATGPTQAVGADGRIKVTIGQTQEKAILSWDSFNVGRETDLTFNQKGNTNWVALNRVTDISADPSKILGSIKADGSVYIINRNGIIFGGASQVNTRNLIASTANITDTQFMDRGIYSTVANKLPTFTNAGGSVVVEAGALLTTSKPATVVETGGFVLLMGSSVENKGTITSAGGQTTLAAGDAFVVRGGNNTDDNRASTTRGNEIAVETTVGGLSGTVINSGIIEAREGDITLAGRTVTQGGYALSTTTVNARGTIHLLTNVTDATSSVTLGKDSVTLIVPDLDNKATATNAQRNALLPVAGEVLLRPWKLNNQGQGNLDYALPDRRDLSRVEIVTGGSVNFDDRSLTLATGGQIAVRATGRVTVGADALLDVSGSQGVMLAMESNVLKVNIQPYELRDSPLNRDNEGLKSNDVLLDIRNLTLLPSGTGGYVGDRYYTAGGLIEVGGYLGNTAHGIGEWTAQGGTITIVAKEVVAHAGSTFNIGGGSIDYAAGYSQSSMMMGSDGKMYDIGRAPAGVTMLSIGKGFVITHDRVGAKYTEVYSNLFGNRTISTRYEAGYTVGRDAGVLTLSAPTVLFEGNILADVTISSYQDHARPDLPVSAQLPGTVTGSLAPRLDGYALPQNVAPLAGGLFLGNQQYDNILAKPEDATRFESKITFGKGSAVTGTIGLGDALASDLVGTMNFSSTALNRTGLGGLKVVGGAVTIDQALVLAHGAQATVQATNVTVNADITAHSGTITLFARPAALDGTIRSDLTIAAGVKIDATGLWTNLLLDPAGRERLAHIDGGDVFLSSARGAVTLGKGSLIDVSAGGAVLYEGEQQGARGGDIAVMAGQFGGEHNMLTLNGELRSYGSGDKGGGALTLTAGQNIVFGGKLTQVGGTLGAGETALATFYTAQDITIAAGGILPFDFAKTVSTLTPGVPLTRPASFEFVEIPIRSPWIIPEGYEAYDPDFNYYGPGDTLPGNAEYASYISALLPAGAIIPADIFTGPIPITPYIVEVKAGEIAPEPLTFAAGLKIAKGATFSMPIAIQQELSLSPTLLQSGFTQYDIQSHGDMVIGSGVTLAPTVSVRRFTGASLGVATGAAPADALDLWLPPEKLMDDVRGQVVTRAGAGLRLVAAGLTPLNALDRYGRNIPAIAIGDLTLQQGATIRVDDGQSVELRAADSLYVDGQVTARGGAITIASMAAENVGRGDGYPLDPPYYDATRSIWLGANSLLDVSGRAVTGVDTNGLRYGTVSRGGSITVGGPKTTDFQGKSVETGTAAFVILRPGARLDASGASATIDLATNALGDQSRPLTIATDGGAIAFNSQYGLFLDGDMRAAAGGAGASGGTLTVQLITPYLPQLGVGTGQEMPDFMRTLRTITLDQTHTTLLPADLAVGSCFTACWRPGDLTTDAETANLGKPDYLNTAHIGVDQIAAGGFANLLLKSNDVISIGAGVDLRMSGTLSLTGAITSADPDGVATLSAAYVNFVSASPLGINIVRRDTGSNATDDKPLVGTGSLTITGGLIDIGSAKFGATGGIGLSGGRLGKFNLAAPGEVSLVSASDIRMTGGTLLAPGNLTLTAAQIYPTTGAVAAIQAGVYSYSFPGNTSIYNTLTPGGTVTFRGLGGAAPQAPLSIYGTLSVMADIINQGGVLRAPLGLITLGAGGDKYVPGLDQIVPDQTYWSGVSIGTSEVNLLAGSLTSVSAKGLTVPYGGTIDGLNWTLNGTTLKTTLASQGVTMIGAIDVQQGATLDLSGGGTAAGVGFITGRGGSVDVLQAALADANPGYAGISTSGNPVYAIVPAYQNSYAPTGLIGGDQPGVGQQITIGNDDIPGLKAGTYMLLPAEYALLDGGFRVELGATAIPGGKTVPVGEGSYQIGVTTGIANTAVKSSLPVSAIVTPGITVRTYSQYNETDFAKFLVSAPNVALFNNQPSLLPQDGKILTLALINRKDGDDRPVFSFKGTGLFAADTGGHGGTLAVVSPLYYDKDFKIEILGAGGTATSGYRSLYASDLNAVGASMMVLGGSAAPISLDPRSPMVVGITPGDFGGGYGNAEVTIRSGAELAAPQILLVTNSTGTISIERGARLTTIGKGAAAYSAANGYAFAPTPFVTTNKNILAVSNGLVEFSGITGNSAAKIDIAAGAELLTEGTITFATTGTVRLDENAVYGGRYIGFATSSINIGTTAALASAQAGGILPGGISFNQGVLDRLLQGSGATGVPALERLLLTAQQSVNFYGAVDLDTIDPTTGKSKVQLVLSTPAIYGYGDAGDAATIRTGTLVWNGLAGTRNTTSSDSTVISAKPGGVIAGGAGTGHGTLNLIADTLVLGYQDGVQVNGTLALDRIALGFGTVNLAAAGQIVSNNRGTLSVYEAQAEYGKPGTGGALSFSTPLVTGTAGSVMTYTAGGAVTLAAPTGAAAAATKDAALGAEIRVNGASITADTTIALPSGKLVLTAAGAIRLGTGARFDMAGREITFFDQKRYSFGGDVVLESATGGIAQAVGSVIDLGARYNDAGTLKLTALSGAVDLAGTITAAAFTDEKDAVLRQGGIDIRAGSIADFTALNQRLTVGGVTDSRAFLVKTGNLVIGDEIKARNVLISADGGSLTVNGRIDASGQRPGTIQLAARDGLTLAATAVLDTRATLIERDSYGAAVEASNRGHVSLATSAGTLTLASGATIDLTSLDGVSRGQVELSAPRVNGNDIAISAAGAIAIRGADSISVNGYRSYQPDGGVIDQGLLDAIHGDSAAFVDAALGNAGLIARLSGLTSYRDAFHLRPGVELRSAAGGNLMVSGDVDLAGYRYASLNPDSPLTAVYGSGEVGRLTIRAANDLDIYGSITDGFAKPAATPDDNGWLLLSGGQRNYEATTPTAFRVPGPVTLDAGTSFSAHGTLTFDLAVNGGQVASNARVPVAVTLSGDVTLGVDWIATADITLPDGASFAKGSVIPTGTVLPAGARLDAGSVLPNVYGFQPMTIARGNDLSFSITALVAAAAVTLQAGDIIPALANVVLPDGATSVNLRPDGGGKIFAAAAMLAAGSSSWSIDLVAGADLASAHRLAVLPKSQLAAAGLTGDITLSDRHYGTIRTTLPPIISPEDDPEFCATPEGAIYCFGETVTKTLPSFSVVRTGTGALTIAAGGNYAQSSLFGVYTAGTQSAAIGGTTADGYNPYNLPRGTLAQGGTTDSPVLGNGQSGYNDAVSAYQAWYPEHGGDLSITTQGSVSGYSIAADGAYSRASSTAIGNWLWRQGAYGLGDAGEDVPTAWWINFGTYVPFANAVGYDAPLPMLTGFTGMGTLGGGNLSVVAGDNAGVLANWNIDNGGGAGPANYASTGLNLAVGGTGRVTNVTRVDGFVTGGTVAQTGGGTLDVRIGGAINSGTDTSQNTAPAGDLGGVFTNVRGDITIMAGAVGRSIATYGKDYVDPRQLGSLYGVGSVARGGIVVAPTDGIVTIATRGDLVLNGATDPGLVDQPGAGNAFLRRDADGALVRMDGDVLTSGFSLWQPDTAIALFSAGGNLNPTQQGGTVRDGRAWYPAILKAVAASGNIYLTAVGNHFDFSGVAPLELAASPLGTMQMLAAGSLLSDGELSARDDNGVFYAIGLPLAISGMSADPDSVPNIFKPAWETAAIFTPGEMISRPVLDNLTVATTPYSRLAFLGDNALGGLGGVKAPALFYAANGDINQLNFGFMNYAEQKLSYVGAGPAQIRASRDIVNLGTSPVIGCGFGGPADCRTNVSLFGLVSQGGLVVHNSASDITLISAGRDILYANMTVAGPGNLVVEAGRNIYQADQGRFTSVGPLFDITPSTRNGGAGITVITGVGAGGPNYAALITRYLDPANLADPARPLADQPGKAVKTYTTELAAWLKERFDFTGTAAEALGYFGKLPGEQQEVFARQVYYDELKAGGREYNDPASSRFGSYLRGREAIATLLPEKDAAGNAISYTGDLTMLGGSGIRTLFGGDIEVMVAGGQALVGVGGVNPPSTAGVVSLGSGDVDFYALNSVLLGQSRVFTTFGGDILMWSAAGDINAGRGTKSTVVYQPPRRVYDLYGNVTISPPTANTGAGIATLAPIPDIPAGDIDLIAPLGTIDAGEAGIRVSGNVNLAALRVLNAANIQVKGNAAGIPVVAAVNTGALTAASNAAASAVNEATRIAERTRPQIARDLPSIITAQLIGFGE